MPSILSFLLWTITRPQCWKSIILFSFCVCVCVLVSLFARRLSGICWKQVDYLLATPLVKAFFSQMKDKMQVLFILVSSATSLLLGLSVTIPCCCPATPEHMLTWGCGGGYFGLKIKEEKCGCAPEIITYTAGMQDSTSPSAYIRQLQSTSSQPSDSSFSKPTYDSLGCTWEPHEVLHLTSLNF